jgi:hypothetical protein
MTDKKRGLGIEDLSVEDLRDAKGKSVHPMTYSVEDSRGVTASFASAADKRRKDSAAGNVDDLALFIKEGDELKNAGFQEPVAFKL